MGMKVKFNPSKLDDPDFNVRLGRAYLTDLLSDFDGSYILTLVGYNAGPSRVNRWLDDYGDPRSPRIDPIDWIESIPYGETRSYQQIALCLGKETAVRAVGNANGKNFAMACMASR